MVKAPRMTLGLGHKVNFQGKRGEVGEHASLFLLSLLFEFLFFWGEPFSKKFDFEFRGNYFEFPAKKAQIWL